MLEGSEGHIPKKKVSFKQVSCGGSHTLAISEKGMVYSCGSDMCGQLGHGKDRGELESHSIENESKYTIEKDHGMILW